jgi:hypothetical protein
MRSPLATTTIALAAVFPLALPTSATAAAEDSVTVTYEGTDENIANPERGFYRHSETRYYTQILRVFYMEKFVDQPEIDQEQLTPILRQYADVIPVVQSGFVGMWGEGYYTDHFVADPLQPGVVSDDDWAKRAAVVAALVEALPDNRVVQARTPLMKQKLLGIPSGPENAITQAEAWTDARIARVGFHNDCFLNN